MEEQRAFKTAQLVAAQPGSTASTRALLTGPRFALTNSLLRHALCGRRRATWGQTVSRHAAQQVELLFVCVPSLPLTLAPDAVELLEATCAVWPHNSGVNPGVTRRSPALV